MQPPATNKKLTQRKAWNAPAAPRVKTKNSYMHTIRLQTAQTTVANTADTQDTITQNPSALFTQGMMSFPASAAASHATWDHEAPAAEYPQEEEDNEQNKGKCLAHNEERIQISLNCCRQIVSGNSLPNVCLYDSLVDGVVPPCAEFQSLSGFFVVHWCERHGAKQVDGFLRLPQ